MSMKIRIGKTPPTRGIFVFKAGLMLAGPIRLIPGFLKLK